MLWALQWGKNAKRGTGFSSKGGVRAQLKKVVAHEDSKIHRYCGPRLELVKGNLQPEADIAVARAFRAEVIKFKAVLIAEGLDVRSVNEAVHRMCPAEGEGNEETKEAQGDGLFQLL